MNTASQTPLQADARGSKALPYGVAAMLTLIVGPPLTAGVMAMGLSLPVGGVLALGVCLVATGFIVPRLPRRGSRIVLIAWFGLGLLGAVRLADLSVFMFDVHRSPHAFDPFVRDLDDERLAKPFFPKHDCFTCYIVAAHLAAERVDNLYDRKYYRRAEEPTPIHDQIGESLDVDTYQYPPPFLILPSLLAASGGDFYQLRAGWYALNVALFSVMVVTMALWIDRSRFHAYWLLGPAMLCTPALLGTLQIQNVHLFLISICLLALPAFDTRRNWLGGALLGFAIVSKIFPGLLLVFLLLQRRWRAVAWTCGWMAAFCAVALVWVGPQPFQAFVSYQLPRLASGEAFAFATNYTAPMLKNGSILGIAYKLEMLGLLSDPKATASILVAAFTALLLGVLVLVGLRGHRWSSPGDQSSPKQPSPEGALSEGTLSERALSEGALSERPSPEGQSPDRSLPNRALLDPASPDRRVALARVWLAIFILAQLRSPFLPWIYGNVPSLFLILLLLPTGWKLGRTLLLILAAVPLAIVVPLPFGPTGITPDLILTLCALAIVLICCTVALLPKPRAAVLVESPFSE